MSGITPTQMQGSQTKQSASLIWIKVTNPIEVLNVSQYNSCNQPFNLTDASECNVFTHNCEHFYKANVKNYGCIVIPTQHQLVNRMLITKSIYDPIKIVNYANVILNVLINSQCNKGVTGVTETSALNQVLMDAQILTCQQIEVEIQSIISTLNLLCDYPVPQTILDQYKRQLAELQTAKVLFKGNRNFNFNFYP